MFGLTTLIRFGLPALALAFVVSFGYTFATNYQKMQAQITTLERDLSLRDYREASYRRQIDRRDEAIKASKCADKITYWVSHPDEIPKPFSPFDQLTAPNLK